MYNVKLDQATSKKVSRYKVNYLNKRRSLGKLLDNYQQKYLVSLDKLFS